MKSRTRRMLAHYSITAFFAITLMPIVLHAAPTNGKEAYRLGDYSKAAEALSNTSGRDKNEQYYLGRMRLYGYGLPRDTKQAIDHFNNAANQGDFDAQWFLATYALQVQNDPELALKWFVKAAANNEDAQMYAAAAYIFGYGTNKRPDTARKYYIAAAKSGNALAQYTLAKRFIESRHRENHRLGMIWLNKSLEQGNPKAQLYMGKLYANGNMVDKNFAKARELIQKSAAQGYVPAIYEMGELAASQQNYEQAKAWFSDAIDKHYDKAKLALGNLYLDDKTPFYDPTSGFLLILKASQSGYPEAQKRLSNLYKEGIGVEKDANLAEEWQKKIQEKSVAKTNTSKQVALWLSYRKTDSLSHTQYALKGILSPWQNARVLEENKYNQAPEMDEVQFDEIFHPDFTMVQPDAIPLSDYFDALLRSQHAKQTNNNRLQFPEYDLNSKLQAKDNAVKTLENRAVLGDPNSQFELGQIYQKGVGVSKNGDKALEYYKMAAEQDDVRAEYMLGVLYIKGDLVEPDYKTGLIWLEDAAFKGSVYAQYALAQLFQYGYSDDKGEVLIKPDIELANNMYYLASAGGYGPAEFVLAQNLSREEPASKTVSARQDRFKLIKTLYQDAVKQNVEQAVLPLAFFNAESGNVSEQADAFNVALAAAKQGDEPAALLVGMMYDRGIGTTENSKEALYWFKKVQYNPIASFILGTCYGAGLQGMSVDKEKGRELLASALDSGFSYAKLNLAILDKQLDKPFLETLQAATEDGNSLAGVLLADYYLTQAQLDKEKMLQAQRLYEKFANSGDRLAQLKLGYMLEKGLVANPAFDSAAAQYLKAADQGQPVAQFLLGRLYQAGVLTSGIDYNAAIQWYGKAKKKYAPAAVAQGFVYETVFDNYKNAHEAYQLAEQSNNNVGRFNLALMYKYGKGVPVNMAAAEPLFLDAAKANNASAMVAVAKLYLTGGAGNLNIPKAHAWYEKAANKGDSFAMYQLGLMSESGISTKQDLTQAVHYYRLAADAGNQKARLALARLYELGHGVPKDIERAKNLYEELAKKNNVSAQYHLGVLYAKESHSDASLNKARMWLGQAAKNGCKPAENWITWLSAVHSQGNVSFIEPVNLGIRQALN